MVAAGMVVACGTASDRVSAPDLTTPADAGTDQPTSKPQPTATSGPTTDATLTSAPTTAPVEADAGAADGSGADGPFGRGPGRGSVAPAPPAGPLVDGTTGQARAAVAVKIDNIAEAWPQAGINQADITFELLVEGVSRFAAVFSSEDAGLIGPVRSARTSDVNLLSMLNRPCFAFSGGNAAVVQAVDAAPLVDVSAEVTSSAYFRSDDRVIPHNLMTSSAGLRAVCEGSGTPSPIFAYGGGPDPRGVEVGGVALRLGASTSRFVWDPPAARWLRFVDDFAQVDTAGVQVSPANVVVLDTGYLPSPADNRSPEAQSLGSGGAWVLVDGLAVSGTWQRSSPTEPYRLLGEDDAPITLRPGRTWVVLAPSGTAQLLGR